LNREFIDDQVTDTARPETARRLYSWLHITLIATVAIFAIVVAIASKRAHPNI
jgi:hypothetical protein